MSKIQKSTLQIGGEEDHLRKGDILFNINGEELAYKNKFELVSKLSSLGGIAEVSVLRKINPTNCFGSNNPEQQVPYHNGIFAQNSIKLAMRKYEKPSMKSNSEVELNNAGVISVAQANADMAALNSVVLPAVDVHEPILDSSADQSSSQCEINKDVKTSINNLNQNEEAKEVLEFVNKGTKNESMVN